MARSAKEQLCEKGTDVKLETYPGGHGWRGNVFGALRGGVSWLEEQTQQRPEK
jgi:predicted esterase